MKLGALLVNTSSTGLIGTDALASALHAGRPGVATVDVHDIEPLADPNDPLLATDNVVRTPHIGFLTHGEWELKFADIFDEIVAYARGNPINVVSPGAQSLSRARGPGVGDSGRSPDARLDRSAK